MYNGIGLTTPRGSGTNGYIVRNLSHMRSHDTAADRMVLDAAPIKHREPDQEILEHERKRKVEVACYELRVKLEDEEKEEDFIEQEVEVLRKKLLDQLARGTRDTPHQLFKPSDTHAILAAKKAEMAKMAKALGTSLNYVEGQAFDPVHQEEQKRLRMERREQHGREEEEKRKARASQQIEWKEKERLRRRAEDAARGGAKGRPAPRDAPVQPPPSRRPMMPPPTAPTGPRGNRPPRRDNSRSQSPPLRRVSERPRSRDKLRRRSPPSNRRRASSSPSRSRSPSRSPPRVKRSPPADRVPPSMTYRRDSPPRPVRRPERGRSKTRSPLSPRRSLSPNPRDRRNIPGKRRSLSRSRSPRSDNWSRSRSSPPRSGGRGRSYDSRSRSRSRTPPRRNVHRGGVGRGGFRRSPPRRGGYRGGYGRRTVSPPPRGRSRTQSGTPPRRRDARQDSRSRSRSPAGPKGADSHMRSKSPPAKRSPSAARSDGSGGSMAMDESD